MWKKLSRLILLGSVLVGTSSPAMARQIVAEELLVDLRAQDLEYGAVTTWPNSGTLGDFTAVGAFVVEDASGRKAVTFDGQGYFEGPASVPGIEGNGARSIEVWAFNPNISPKECLVSWGHRGGPSGSNLAFSYGNQDNCGAVGHWGGPDMGWTGEHAPAPAAGVWWYLVYTYDGVTVRVYVNGQENTTKDFALVTHSNCPIRIGHHPDSTGAGVHTPDYIYSGSITVVRIHDGVLSPSDIAYNFTATLDNDIAAYPSPKGGATELPRDVVLSWIPGEFAAAHDVYFGTVFDDVNDASRADPRDVLARQGQATSGYDPAGLLAYGQTYYWRIDEVNAPSNPAIFKGDVWSFATEPYSYPIGAGYIKATASSSDDANMGPEKTVDKSGLNDRDEHSTVETEMWLSAVNGPQPAWIQYEFDKPYRLHQMWVWNSNQSLEPAVGLGARSVTIEYATKDASSADPGNGVIVAEELLVDLRAQDLEYGAVTTWPNRGTLGNFTAGGALVLEDVDGRKAVTFEGQSHFEGPLSVPGIEGNGTRSIEVWAFNPDIGSKECMVSWGHRGGPSGSNVGFTYGSRLDCGALAHWGGGAFDMGWTGPHSPAPAAGVWWYLVYTYDGITARLYVNGEEETTKDIGALTTHPNFPIRLGTQANDAGDKPDGGSYYSGSIAVVRIHDGVLSPSDITSNFTHTPEDEPVNGPSAETINWVTLGEFEFDQAPGKAGCPASTIVDFAGVAATHVRLVINSAWGNLLDQCGLSEVRFFYVPVLAREPQPASGQADVPPDVVLGWRAGREAASHEVYIGTDASDLPLAGTVSGNSYDTTPLDLQLGEIYYWKINEVNEATTPGSWEGETWSFSMPDYLVVDDFESYNDDVEAGTTIFDTWIDGVTNNTGSTVGYWTAPFAEQTIVHGGKQSMPLTYDNSAATYSEAERIFDVSQDWSRAGIQTLTLFFYGTQGNTGQLYVKINGKKVDYAGAADAIAKPRWTQWNIDLGSVGVDLQSVTKLTIGIEGTGSGIVYIDDIRLYRTAPVPPREEIWLEAEAAETVTAPMKVYDDDPTAMDGKYIGTDDAIGDSSDNPPAPDGTATYTFTVQGGVYKVSGRVIIPNGESFWVRIPGATTQTLNHSSGWVKWSDPPQGRDWHWAEVFSADDGNVVVQFTMAAGTYELEIGYREDGAWLDAIVIESVH